MKKYFFVWIFFISCFVAFSYEGTMAKQKNLKIVKTKYFDLIYPEKSKETASILFEKADSIYEEVAQKYKMKHKIRISVVITPSTDQSNAYYSSAPFSHIVIYDTPPSKDEIFHSEKVINTFRHEIVHAVTYNLHNDFWHGIKTVFGDVYNPALLTITMGFAEGAAVSTESDFGEGRVNSDFHKQLVRQAKIEGKFPKFSEIQGAKDNYSTGNYSYYFGGEFCAYLQKKYGMEKFAEFWYKCVNFQTLTYFGCFKRVYGISIKKAWKDFYDSIEIPDIKSSPDTEDWCEQLALKKSSKNAKHPIWDFPVFCENGIVFYDAVTSKVMFAPKNNENFDQKNTSTQNLNSFKKPKTLFAQKNVSRLDVSQDGTFIAASYTSSSGRLVIKKVRIFNTKTGRSFYLDQKNIRDASVFCVEGKYYLVAVKTYSQNCAVEIYELNLAKNGNIKNADLIFEEKLNFEELAFSASGGTNGNIYFIKKSGSEYSIQHRNFLNNNQSQIVLPNKIKPHALSVCYIENSTPKDQERLVLNFTSPGTMPRLALCGVDFAKKTASLRLSSTDSSGGIFNPTYISGSQFIYTANFLSEKKIFVANAAKIPFETQTIPIKEIKDEKIAEKSENVSSEIGKIQIEGEKNFSLFKYQFTGQRGTIVPVAISQSYAIRNSEKFLFSPILDSISIPFGITYVSSSPWTIPIYTLSAGYNAFTNSGAINASINGGTYLTDIYKYKISANVEFDEDGYKQAYGSLSLSSKILLRGLSYIKFSDSFQIFEGRQSLLEAKNTDDYFNPRKWLGLLRIENGVDNFLQTNTASLGIGNIAKSGKNYYDYNGVEFSVGYDENICLRISEPYQKYYDYQNLYVDFIARNANLLPIKLEFALFPSRDFFMAGMAEVVLFSYEIQKSTNFFPILYANRFSISTHYIGRFSHNYKTEINSWGIFHISDYAGYLKDGDFSYSDEVSLCANLFLTPNVGGAARSNFQLQFTGKISIRPNQLPNQKFIAASFGLNSSLK